MDFEKLILPLFVPLQIIQLLSKKYLLYFLSYDVKVKLEHPVCVRTCTHIYTHTIIILLQICYKPFTKNKK